MKLSIANIFIIINEINLLYNWRKCLLNFYGKLRRSILLSKLYLMKLSIASILSAKLIFCRYD